MNTALDLLEKNPFSVYSVYNRITGQDKDSKKDVVEGFGWPSRRTPMPTSRIFFGFLMSIVFLYAQYIIIKCYCGDYLKVIFFTIFMTCCCPCVIPYLFYKHFGDGCGNGRIGMPVNEKK